MIDSSSQSHKLFVERFIDTKLLGNRLMKFPYLRMYFENSINTCVLSPPYYCHYMGWRLGTWTDERPFEVFNELIGICSNFTNWDRSKKKGQFSSCAFGEYWSLLWELQVAYFFSKAGGEVSWMASGPDFKVKYNGHEFFVECTTLRKSFELNSFIEEIFRELGRDIRVNHRWFVPFTLPKGKDANVFLDEMFRPYLDSGYLNNKRDEAKNRYPFLLPVPDGTTNLYIYLEGDDTKDYISDIVPNIAGDPESYIDVMLREVIKNKSTSNSLMDNRPNLLAINFLLSAEFQMATDRQHCLKYSMPKIDLGDSLDAILYSACGITDEVECPTIFSLMDSHIVRKFPHSAG